MLSPVLGGGDTAEQNTAWALQEHTLALVTPSLRSPVGARKARMTSPLVASGKASLRRCLLHRRMTPLSSRQGRTRHRTENSTRGGMEEELAGTELDLGMGVGYPSD